MHVLLRMRTFSGFASATHFQAIVTYIAHSSFRQTDKDTTTFNRNTFQDWHFCKHIGIHIAAISIRALMFGMYFLFTSEYTHSGQLIMVYLNYYGLSVHQ